MPVVTSWKLNPSRFADILKSQGVADELLTIAAGIESVAQQSAPYDDRPGRKPGKPHYRDSFTTGIHHGPRRNTARVANTSPQAWIVEYGNGTNTPAHHTLESAAAARATGVH